MINKNSDINNDEMIICDEIKKYIDLLKSKNYSLFNTKTIELCLVITNKLIIELMNYYKLNKYEIPEDKMLFVINFLGKEYFNHRVLFLLHGLITNNTLMLIKLFDNPINETINLLKIFESKIDNIDNIFEKNKFKTIKYYDC